MHLSNDSLILVMSKVREGKMTVDEALAEAQALEAQLAVEGQCGVCLRCTCRNARLRLHILINHQFPQTELLKQHPSLSFDDDDKITLAQQEPSVSSHSRPSLESNAALTPNYSSIFSPLSTEPSLSRP